MERPSNSSFCFTSSSALQKPFNFSETSFCLPVLRRLPAVTAKPCPEAMHPEATGGKTSENSLYSNYSTRVYTTTPIQAHKLPFSKKKRGASQGPRPPWSVRQKLRLLHDRLLHLASTVSSAGRQASKTRNDHTSVKSGSFWRSKDLKNLLKIIKNVLASSQCLWVIS